MISQRIPEIPLQALSKGANHFPWYGLRTKSNCEKTASAVLGIKGYDYYLPLYRVRRRWSDRVVVTELPLLPGYIFCRLDAMCRLSILTTPGVVSIISCGKVPVPIPEIEIDAIQAILRSGNIVEPCPYLREGQRIRINRGSLEGLEGILLKKKAEWSMVISVTMLQRSVAVEIDREWITAI